MAGLAVKYLVRFSAADLRWNVYRGGAAFGFARKMEKAIQNAVRAASQEAATTDLAVTVWLEERLRKYRKVWPEES